VPERGWVKRGEAYVRRPVAVPSATMMEEVPSTPLATAEVAAVRRCVAEGVVTSRTAVAEETTSGMDKDGYPLSGAIKETKSETKTGCVPAADEHSGRRTARRRRVYLNML
jgi:hypothetical protein